MNTRKIIIIGKSATGKNFVAERMNKSVFFNFKLAVYDTTRQKRENEVDGVDYFFMSRFRLFMSMFVRKYIIKTSFNGWKYYLSKSEYEFSNVIICSPAGLDQLLDTYKHSDLYVILLVENYDVRKKRLLTRNSIDSVERRLKADEMDFINIHRKADYICSSYNYGRLVSNAANFLRTGHKLLNAWDDKKL